jgi:hypothetical protein
MKNTIKSYDNTKTTKNALLAAGRLCKCTQQLFLRL